MKELKNFNKTTRPVKVLQFGEGGFLRGFIDWMIQIMNDSNTFNGNVVVVQPIENGMCNILKEQNCLYTHIIRGVEGTETKLIDVIDNCINPYEDFEKYLSLAENVDLRFIVSNTTESGIEFLKSDKNDGSVPKSFPGKLTLLLKRRFDKNLPGFIFLPCELIEFNGDKLKETVLQYAKLWNFSEDFCNYIINKNIFCNTLVDRINTGYPKDETFDFTYSDNMINTSEYFHLFVIETDYDIEKELPFSKAGLNVIVTKDALSRYRTRKVRILNGAHTSMVPYALLMGFETVKDCIDDDNMRSFINGCLEEIKPTLDLSKKELDDYANSVLTRFANPYIKHYLSAISLNSISKFKVRVLPSILEYKKRFGVYPKNLIFSFAKLIEFYQTSTPIDDMEIISLIREHSLEEILSNEKLWGEDLSYLKEVITNANT